MPHHLPKNPDLCTNFPNEKANWKLNDLFIGNHIAGLRTDLFIEKPFHALSQRSRFTELGRSKSGNAILIDRFNESDCRRLHFNGICNLFSAISVFTS